MSAPHPSYDFPTVRRQAFALLLAASMSVGLASAQGQSPTDQDPVERTMTFVEHSQEATELYGVGRIEEALAIFQEAFTLAADLDEDGHVAMSIADCLALLNRTAEARAAYENAAAGHPELRPAIEHRLIELELAGEISDSLLDRLRAAVATDPGNAGRAWHLTQALLKRAAALLPEAADAYSLLLQTGTFLQRSPKDEDLQVQLQEIRDQLLALATIFNQSSSSAMDTHTSPVPAQVIRSHQTWTIRTPAGTQVAFEAHQPDPDHRGRFLANGNPVELTPAQQIIIKQHQNRINAILLEALAQQSQNPERR